MKQRLLWVLGGFLFSMSGVSCSIEDDLLREELIEDIYEKEDSIEQDSTDNVELPLLYETSIHSTINGIGRYKNKTFQGFAAYNEIGFCFYDTGFCQTIDLKDQKIISSFQLPEGVASSKNHCGVACFSNEYLTPDAPYPLLYLSSYKEQKCYVLNMTEQNAELVQIIMMKDAQEEVVPVYAFMPDDDKLLLKMKTPSKINNSYHYHWMVVPRPKIIDSHDVIICLNDTLYSFYVESSDKYNAGFAYHNRIYQLAGYGGKGSKKMYVIDYIKKKVMKEVVWEEYILYNEEQEQCTPYGNDGILINYNGADYISYVKFRNWKL